jgi:hypothetical protein
MEMVKPTEKGNGLKDSHTANPLHHHWFTAIFWIILLFIILCGGNWLIAALNQAYIPVAPVPAEAVRIRRQPEQGYFAAGVDAQYFEEYVTRIPPEDVVAFYQEHGFFCRIIRAGRRSVLPYPYWLCRGNIRPYGTLSLEVQRRRELPRETILRLELRWML